MGTFANFVATALVEHIVGQGDIDNSLEHLHIHIGHFFSGQRARQFVGQSLIERVALAFGVYQLFDELVRGVDFVHQFRDVDVALRHIVGVVALELVIGFLKFGVGAAEFLVALLLIG